MGDADLVKPMLKKLGHCGYFGYYLHCRDCMFVILIFSVLIFDVIVLCNVVTTAEELSESSSALFLLILFFLSSALHALILILIYTLNRYNSFRKNKYETW